MKPKTQSWSVYTPPDCTNNGKKVTVEKCEQLELITRLPNHSLDWLTMYIISHVVNVIKDQLNVLKCHQYVPNMYIGI